VGRDQTFVRAKFRRRTVVSIPESGANGWSIPGEELAKRG
jgi:hypothetical protein